MSKSWRCALIGAGVIGEFHAQIISHLNNASLVAVCDSNTERAKAMLEKLKLGPLPIYATAEEMFKKEKIDIVHICTPSGSHLEPALIAMTAGVNVICEKPLEVNLDRIDRMIEASHKHKVRLAGIFQNRWNPSNRAIYDAVQAGRFGKVAWAGCFTPWYRTDDYYRSGGWRGTWKLDGGGAMMNQSIHAVDLLQWIAGPIKTLSAFASSRIHAAIEVEDTLSCSLEFASGAFGTIMGSTAMYPGGSVRIEIGGENGTAVSEDGLKVFKFRDERPADLELQTSINQVKVDVGGGTSQFLSSFQNHILNIEAILKSWDQNQDATTDGPEARKAIAIVLAMYESARKGGAPVSLR